MTPALNKCGIEICWNPKIESRKSLLDPWVGGQTSAKSPTVVRNRLSTKSLTNHSALLSIKSSSKVTGEDDEFLDRSMVKKSDHSLLREASNAPLLLSLSSHFREPWRGATKLVSTSNRPPNPTDHDCRV